MEIINPEARKVLSIEEHLLTRELVDLDILTLDVMNENQPGGRADITLNQELLSQVASTWETNKLAITAVIAARIKVLLIQAALRDIPQEVTVSRQAMLELIGVLRDFESLYTENVARNQNRPEPTPVVPAEET